jgi:hypothetical protein
MLKKPLVFILCNRSRYRYQILLHKLLINKFKPARFQGPAFLAKLSTSQGLLSLFDGRVFAGEFMGYIRDFNFKNKSNEYT